MLLNNNTTFIKDLYKYFHITPVRVAYSINEQRNHVNELLLPIIKLASN
ncbi:putative site-specific DNA adenine methylase [Orientia chuto str. Dubai]|uniref:Putative site-specific DNA adenine methylase n=1 Tax=Orientia chuto str. Dubai TaxID=1359168 RepID=A0A0F3MFE9_9RICK|nr:putative site-specific DNA adenine methylase [Orientia chuto str. Dubai]